MATTKTIYRPKWLDETKRDRRTGSDTTKYIANLKRAAREVAAVLYSERGGNNALYTKLRNAYLDVEDAKYSLKDGEPDGKD